MYFCLKEFALDRIFSINFNYLYSVYFNADKINERNEYFVIFCHPSFLLTFFGSKFFAPFYSLTVLYHKNLHFSSAITFWHSEKYYRTVIFVLYANV